MTRKRPRKMVDLLSLIHQYVQAAVWCDIFEPKKWLELSKEKLRTGRHKEVFEEIANKYASLEDKEKDNGLTKRYRYMEKRLNYMN